jgi:hypothetical protein
MAIKRVKSNGVKRDPNAWVVERLLAWGKWNQLSDNGYGRSSLVFDEIRSAPQLFVPIFGIECEQTERAVSKQPPRLREVAILMYVQECDQVTIGRKLKISERHIRRLHEALVSGVKSYIEAQRVGVSSSSRALNVTAA